MNKVIAILQKELRTIFYSPVAWVTVTIFMLCAAYVFQLYFFEIANISVNRPDPFNAPQLLTRVYFGFISTIFLFLIPLITMGVYAEERKKGTSELLFTVPLTNFQIVAGKFLSGLAFAAFLLAGSAVVLLPLFFTAPPDTAPFLLAYLGLALYAGAVVALGNFISTLTENQVVAAAITFVLMLVLFLFNQYSARGTEGLQGVLGYLSPIRHLDDFINGVFDLSHAVYFLSAAALGLFLTYRSLESNRWRG